MWLWRHVLVRYLLLFIAFRAGARVRNEDGCYSVKVECHKNNNSKSTNTSAQALPLREGNCFAFFISPSSFPLVYHDDCTTFVLFSCTTREKKEFATATSIIFKIIMRWKSLLGLSIFGIDAGLVAPTADAVSCCATLERQICFCDSSRICFDSVVNPRRTCVGALSA